MLETLAYVYLAGCVLVALFFPLALLVLHNSRRSFPNDHRHAENVQAVAEMLRSAAARYILVWPWYCIGFPAYIGMLALHIRIFNRRL